MAETVPSLKCTLPLPPGYRAEDILRFHRRDPEAVAEAVTTDSMRKGLCWQGKPACLSIAFTGQAAQAELRVEGGVAPGETEALARLLRRMLGLTQDIETFEMQYGAHPVIGPLVQAQRGLRVPVAASPFEALVWAIIGQQISVHAAISIRRRLLLATGQRHREGLLCHPDAPRLAGSNEATLRAAGLTAAKAATVLAVSTASAAGDLPLDHWAEALPAAEASARLLAQRGIGPWTVNYTLLRGYGWLDGSLHGDVAVRRSLQALLGVTEKIDGEQAAAWLAQFSPWRALVGAHLWAALG